MRERIEKREGKLLFVAQIWKKWGEKNQMRNARDGGKESNLWKLIGNQSKLIETYQNLLETYQNLLKIYIKLFRTY